MKKVLSYSLVALALLALGCADGKPARTAADVGDEAEGLAPADPAAAAEELEENEITDTDYIEPPENQGVDVEGPEFDEG